MGSVPYWVCFHHLGEPRSPFLYLLIDQMLAPTLVTPPVVASATKHMYVPNEMLTLLVPLLTPLPHRQEDEV